MCCCVVASKAAPRRRERHGVALQTHVVWLWHLPQGSPVALRVRVWIACDVWIETKTCAFDTCNRS